MKAQRDKNLTNFAKKLTLHIKLSRCDEELVPKMGLNEIVPKVTIQI